MGQNQKQENSFYLWTNKNGFYENLTTEINEIVLFRSDNRRSEEKSSFLERIKVVEN